ncbi:MAG: Glyoxalase/bleomycin resistance protein/dioxygenase [Caulobacteraceae bacterium]|nr:Glyoxalase/bleomycin resistance protein/dioxygenase [Caulobacteraceae bacterium]
MSVETQEKPDAPAAMGGGVVPAIVVSNANAAAKFYQEAFAGEVLALMPDMKNPDKVMHCHIRINGGSMIFNDAFPEYGFPLKEPQMFTLHLQVDDVKAWWRRALDAGCVVTMPLDVQFWGDRYGQLKDPFGITWSLGGKP